MAKVPVRLVFESALELMSCTQIGTFQVDVVRKLAASAGCGACWIEWCSRLFDQSCIANMQMDPSGKSKGPPPMVKKA